MAINITQLSHHFGSQHVLKHINLDIKAGDIVALLGPSGCGKSTLLRLIAGLETLQSGDIALCEQAVNHLAPEYRNVGFMFQDYALFPHMMVLKNIEYGLDKHNAHRKPWIQEHLNNLGLTELASRYPHTLSGGQQQRVALLRALANEPKVMLLDEPFSALDEHLRQQVREDTLDILRAANTSAVIVTHDPQEALFLADKIAVMEKGRIVQYDTPARIYQHPNNAFIAGFFDTTNTFDSQAQGESIDTPIGRFACEPSLANKAVQVLVRARDVQVSQSKTENSLSARVRSVHPMGPETHLRLSLNHSSSQQALSPASAKTFHAKVISDEAFRPGDEINLTINPDRVYIFDNTKPQA